MGEGKRVTIKLYKKEGDPVQSIENSMTECERRKKKKKSREGQSKKKMDNPRICLLEHMPAIKYKYFLTYLVFTNSSI